MFRILNVNNSTFTMIMPLLIISLGPFAMNDAFAKENQNYITIEDLGVLQLAAHDLFNVDRSIPHDFEDGKLNLSTLFEDTVNDNKPFDKYFIALGGEPRNRENIFLFTVASELGSLYLNLVEDGMDTNEAKQKTISIYHKKLAQTYMKTFREQFPQPIEGTATLQENLALRTIHDFLPGEIKFNKNYVSIFDSSLVEEKLSPSELQQKSSKLDGKFDSEFLKIQTCFPPDFTVCIDVNLLEADRTFGDQFGIEDTFDDMLEELKDGSYDENDMAMTHVRNLMAKGQNFT